MTLHKNNTSHRILGVGNALVDVMIALENDDILHRFGLPRGSMTLVDNRLSADIFQDTRPLHKQMTTGGSAANTIHTLASLGAACGYAGKISRDELGDVFEKEFREKGISVAGLLCRVRLILLVCNLSRYQTFVDDSAKRIKYFKNIQFLLDGKEFRKWATHTLFIGA